MSASTLLAFLDAPVMVGDPDGRVAYVNPAFESLFALTAHEATGQPLAGIFEGGTREAVLQAVAEVCGAGNSTRFRIRHGGVGYAGLASPIEAEDARVGFLILLVANAAEDERVYSLQRELFGPMEELGRVFDELTVQMPVQQSGKARSLIEDGLRSLSRLRKQGEELSALLRSKPAAPRPTSFDAAGVLREVASALSDEFAAARVGFRVQSPAGLPPVRGDAERLRAALVELLRARLAGCVEGSAVSVRARHMDPGGAPSVVVAVLDAHPPGHARESASHPVPDGVRRAVQEFGGDLRTNADAESGRTTAIRLNAVKQ